VLPIMCFSCLMLREDGRAVSWSAEEAVLTALKIFSVSRILQSILCVSLTVDGEVVEPPLLDRHLSARRARVMSFGASCAYPANLMSGSSLVTVFIEFEIRQCFSAFSRMRSARSASRAFLRMSFGRSIISVIMKP